MSKSGIGKFSGLLIVFVVLWVVFSVLCGLSFKNLQENKENLANSQKKLVAAEKMREETRQKIAGLSNLVGFHAPSDNAETLRADVDTIIYKVQKLGEESAELGLSLETPKIDKERLHDVEHVKREVVTLEDVWNACAKRVEDLQKEIKEKSEAYASQKAKLETVTNQTTAEIKRLENSLAEQRAAIEEARKSFESRIEKAEKDRTRAQNAKLKEKATLAETLRSQRNQNNKYESEKENLDLRIGELKAEAEGQTGMERWFKTDTEKEKTQDNPDGSILYVHDTLQTAFIDLGRPEGVLKGMTFLVFRYAKGGEKDYKGKIVIQQVEEKMSKVGIVETKDSLNPIQSGDKIINPVYDRHKVKYFVVAGRLLQKYSLEQVSRLVKQIGGQIEEEITAKTDIVVLGDDFKNSPIYQKAVERGIETMLESEFLDYLGN